MTHPDSDNNPDRDGLPVTERMSDPSDMATQREAEFLSDALVRSRIAVTQKQKPRPDGSYEVTDCEECGSPIGEQRLRVAANNLMCVHCQSDLESRRRHFNF